MSDKIKSAWELALEKIQSQDPVEIPKLTEDQKQAIADIRRKFQARTAEAELASQERIRKAAAAGNYEEIEKAREHLGREKTRLSAEMEREIEKCRAS
jgi:Spy/CpxP family protein refolding chaperone